MSFLLLVIAQDVGPAAASGPTHGWVRQFGTSSADEATGIAVDAAGNAYVVGWVSGTLPGQRPAGTVDAFVRKYDPDGNEVWTRQFGSWDRDMARAVAVGSSGFIYVVGETEGTLPGLRSAGGWDAFVRKYDPSGEEVWTRQVGGGGGDWAAAVATDQRGHTYVAGASGGAMPGQHSAGDVDAFLMELDDRGAEVWTRQFGAAHADTARGLAVGAGGTVTLVGSTANALGPGDSAGGFDGYVRRYDTAGEHLWTRQVGSARDDFAVGVTLDPHGQAVVVGSADGALPGQRWAGGTDAFVGRFDGDGRALWTRQFGGRSADDAWGVAIAPNGDAVVVGNTDHNPEGNPSARSLDFFVGRYDHTGQEIRTRQAGTTDVDLAYSIALAPAGDTLAAGSTRGTYPGHRPAGARDVFVARLPNG